MELRDYQSRVVRETYTHYHKGVGRVLLQMPTGGGKTATCCKIVKDAVNRGRKVLLLAHRNELLTQMQSTLARFGITAGIIKSGVPPTKSPVQVASVQTFVRRIAEHQPSPPGLIVIDEAHRAMGNSYQKIVEAFPGAFLLGLTATPIRLDGKGLGDLFQELVHGPQIHELVERGFLVPPTYYVGSSILDGREVATKRGDYDQSALGDLVSELRLEGDLVSEWQSKAAGLQTIVFAVNIEHSQMIAAAYRDAGIEAMHVDGSTKKDVRARIFGAFARKEFQVLVNVGIVTEGFDLPELGCVQLARPTQSTSLYFQAVGRVLRSAPGKTEGIVLDHAGCYLDHGNVMTPYHWSLKTTKPKEARADWMEDSEPKEKKERIITNDGKEVLVKVSFDLENAWLEELRRVQIICAQKDYKSGWVAKRMMNRFQAMTLEQYRLIAKVCGYHWKWADRQFQAQAEVAA